MESGVGGERTGLGRRGEEWAALFLRDRGWEIVLRNLRGGREEIDLVAARGPILAFIEVKTRRSEAFGHPLSSITPRKQDRIRRVAAGWMNGEEGREWLRVRSRELGRPVIVRFDAIAIIAPRGRTPRIEHLPDAWRG